MCGKDDSLILHNKGFSRILAARKQKTFVHSILPYLAEANVFRDPECGRYVLGRRFSIALPEKTDGEIAGMIKTQRNATLAESSDLALSHFYRRWTALWDDIINGESKPLGHVEDLFWRIESQARGSPHVHMMLWIKDAPECSGISDGPLPNVLRA